MTDAEESLAEQQPNSPPEDLVAEVAAYDEKLAADVADLYDRIDELEDELDEVESELETVTDRLEHTRADFQNYKKRAKRKQEEVKERATEDLVERLLDVRDNLTRALEEESEDVASLREGVKLTRKQFDRVLDAEDVERIEPDPGTAVDANRHEVVHRVENGHPPDTIASVYRPGYEMAGKVLRPAQVTVSEGSASSDDHPDAEGSTGKDADDEQPDSVGVSRDGSSADQGDTAQDPDDGNDTIE
ncbi:MAG: nucleotide exchange factor GrpE [Halodesulfurarchaeum sp.]